ncbi:MAG: hypothetical protein ALAOOOJD_01352 [bacterium]|nr:hypothetical protein [bacterium]
MDAALQQPTPLSRISLARQKKLFFALAFVLLALMVSVLIVEIALRVLYREEDAVGDYFGIGGFVQDDEVGYRHAPNFKGNIYRRNVFECPVSISPLGLRQANFDVQRQYPAKVLILGDSFAFGVGVPEDSIFAALIQKTLNPAGIGVINGGQSGYCVQQETKFGIRLAQLVEPNLIVLALYPNNDVIGDYYKDYANVEVRYGHRLAKDRWLPIFPVDFVRARAYGWMLLEIALKRKSIEAQRAAFFKAAADSAEQMMQPTFNALETLRDYCQVRGIKLGIMLIPAISGKAFFDRPLKNALRAEGIPLLDLGEKKMGRKNYFRGDAHWNKDGHEKVAKQLAPFCLELLEKT